MKKIQSVKSRKNNIIYRNSESTINSDALSSSHPESHSTPPKKIKKTKIRLKMNAWKVFKRKEKEINNKQTLALPTHSFNMGMRGNWKFKYNVKSKLHKMTKAVEGKRNFKYNSFEKKDNHKGLRIFHRPNIKTRLNSISKIYEEKYKNSQRKSSIDSHKEINSYYLERGNMYRRARNQSMANPNIADISELLNSEIDESAIKREQYRGEARNAPFFDVNERTRMNRSIV